MRGLAAALAHSDSAAADLDRFVALWRAGDAEALGSALDAEFGPSGAARDRLVDARNRAWLAPLETFAAQVPTLLVVVGAGHLVGPQGLAALLRAQGWTVAQVPAR